MNDGRKTGTSNGAFRIEKGGYVPTNSGNTANPPKGSGVANTGSKPSGGTANQTSNAQGSTGKK